MIGLNYSVGGWIKYTTNSTNSSIIFHLNGNDYNALNTNSAIYIQITASSGLLQAISYLVNGSKSVTTYTIPNSSIGKWRTEFSHIVVTVQSNEEKTQFTTKLYFNGIIVATKITNGKQKTPYGLRLGYSYEAQYYNIYDEMFISKPLTDEEIQYIYNSGNGRSWDDL